MAASIPAVPVGSWLLAISPVVLLLALVLWGRFSTITNAAVTVVYSVAVGVLAFGADGLTVGVGLGKGAWVGLWILYVIWPALLMHHFASTVGMTALGRVLSTILPRRSENVLLLAWILPSFIQGVSGFGTPIAVAAPLLFALGVGAARSVALPLIGYHWAVGFGSMGSSFYMGALTAHLGAEGTAQYAAAASLALGVNCVLAGVLVALMDGGWHGLREGWRLIALAGPVMAGVQALVARLEPGIGALCAGGAGVVVVLLLHLLHRGGPAGRRTAVSVGAGRAPTGHRPGRRPGGSRGRQPPTGRRLPLPPGGRPGAGTGREADRAGELTAARAAAVPYGLLAVIALAVFLPPAARAWAKGHLQVGPSFPATGDLAGSRQPGGARVQPDRARRAPRHVPAAGLPRQRARVAVHRGLAARVVGHGLARRGATVLEVLAVGGAAGLGRRGAGGHRDGADRGARCGRGHRARLPGDRAPGRRPRVVHHRVDDELQRAVLGAAARGRPADRRPPGGPAGRPARRRQHRQLAGAGGDPARPQRRRVGALGGAGAAHDAAAGGGAAALGGRDDLCAGRDPPLDVIWSHRGIGHTVGKRPEPVPDVRQTSAPEGWRSR